MQTHQPETIDALCSAIEADFRKVGWWNSAPKTASPRKAALPGNHRRQMPAAAANDPVGRAADDRAIKDVMSELLHDWKTVSGGISPELNHKLDGDPAKDEFPVSPEFRRRLAGETDGIGDQSGSGLAFAIARQAESNGRFSSVETACLIYSTPETHVASGYPAQKDAARQLARAIVKSRGATPVHDEQRARIEEARRIAIEANVNAVVDNALGGKSDSEKQQVRDKLSKCCLDRTASGSMVFEANLDSLAVALSVQGKAAVRKLVQKILAAGDAAAAAAALQESAGTRRVIQVTDNLARLHDEAMAAVVDKAGEIGVFLQGNSLVTVAAQGESAFLQRVSDDGGRVLLSRVACFVRGTKPVEPPVTTARTVLEQAAGQKFPLLHLASGLPVLRRDGTVMTAKGYDAETGVYNIRDWSSEIVIPAVLAQNDAREAADRIFGLFSEMPFDGDASRAAFLATVLTPIARHLMQKSPFFLFSASSPASGKSLLTECVSLIATGGPSYKMIAPDKATDDEFRKVITTAFIYGRTLANIDNIAAGSQIHSPVLDKLLTSPTWEDRNLGTHTEYRGPNNLMLMGSGNNVRAGGEVGRRTLVVYLKPGIADPWTRTGFKIPDLPAHILAHRAEIIRDCLIVLAAAIRNAAKSSLSLGSFEEWVQSVAASVEYAIGINPVAALATSLGMDARDEEMALLDWLLSACAAHFGDEPFAVADLFGFGPQSNADAARLTAWADLTEARETYVDMYKASSNSNANRILGNRLRERVNTVTTSGFELVAGRKAKKAMTYRVVSRTSAQPPAPVAGSSESLDSCF